MWNRASKVLVMVFLVLLISMPLVTIVHAQGGGYCTYRYPVYYDDVCRCYRSMPPYWECTGWQRPRHSNYGRVGGYYGGVHR